MRLKSINLSGFKSFVDPTTIDLPRAISVFVGPNGCGKSNVVDAVRLVIGESQASHIRGDSLSDVIFNGTDSRSPTVQASVELIFDNADQRIAGPYAKYSDISMRREVFRDTRSKFFLNGRTCRRKDIQDLFLGSGFGVRGYAIVEQGLISRLVEARPEELRAHIEEVAGISKYRDRRRETEKRIRITNENLERVRDHSAELARHISRLDRQAREAKRFAELKERERLAQARVIAHQVHSLGATLDAQDKIVTTTQLELQKLQTALQATRTNIDRLREEEVLVNETFNKVQGEAFEARSRSGRIEEDISSRQSRISDIEDEASLLTDRRDKLSEEFNEDSNALLEIEQNHKHVERARSDARVRMDEANKLVIEAQNTYDSWQGNWNRLLQNISDLEREKQYAQASLSNMSSNEDELQKRKVRAQSDLELDLDYVLVESIERKLAEAEGLRTQTQETLNRREQELGELERKRVIREKSRNEIEQQVNATRHRLAAHVAVFERAVGRDATQENTDWLRARSLDDKPRLGEQIEVEAEWQRALDVVLGDDVKAIPLEDLEEQTPHLNEEIQDGFILVEPTSIQSNSLKNSLLSHVTKGRESVASLIGNVYAYESLSEALAVRLSLQDHESVVTREGIWIGNCWIRFPGDSGDERSVMELRAVIDSLETQVEKLDAEYDSVRQDLERDQDQIAGLRVETRNLQDELSEHHETHSTLRLELQRKQLELAETKEKHERAQTELNLISSREEELFSESERHTNTVKRCTSQLSVLEDERALLDPDRTKIVSHVEVSISDAQEAGEKFRELDVRFNTMLSTQESLQRSATRRQSDIQELDRQIEKLHLTRNEIATEIEQLRNAQTKALEAYAEVERSLRDVQVERDRLLHNIRENSNNAVLQERQLQEAQQELETHREKLIQLNADKNHLLSDLAATQHSYEEVLAELTERDNEVTLDRALHRILNRIARLGAVNLAAIEDLAALREEQELVTRQVEDLELSQQTLLRAIQKIDSETLSMFESTLENANERLGDVFGKLFGGGSAQLVLMDEDPLTAGVAIRAQPPGKRTKSVNQLSGGEKALAAIAFIFAMFELNPSPVCVLDEVDAPLDDNNVSRFTQLIKEMSEDVQFLIISHNRATMRMADSLIGVTMQEAGVSRLVSVDLETAFESAMN